MVVSISESTRENQLTDPRHIMTGVGSYFYITWAIWLRHCLNERQDEYVLNWPSYFFSLPEVIPRDDVKKGSKKYMNGNSKSEDRKSV